MKKIYYFTLILALIAGCKGVNEPDTSTTPTTKGSVILTGKVYDGVTGLPLKEAVIRVIDSLAETAATTGTDGSYSATVGINSNRDLKVIAQKDGYAPDTIKVYGILSKTIEIKSFSLSPSKDGTTGTASGNPASIYVSKQTLQAIAVKESGSAESTDITFQVLDSLGRAVDITHSAIVTFSVGASPGGGEFIYPLQARTDASGNIILTVTSGTKAGIIQVQASIIAGSTRILSKPVAVAIHGGLPDQAHFSIASNLVNIAGFNIFGNTAQITAFVGDKYGNPARPGTVVYFTTNGGIIDGSAALASSGTGSATLMSCLPHPSDPILGTGFATITASTADENLNKVSAQATILFSGYPVINVSPSSVNIPNGGSQSFSYTVSDQNGNPLAGGTSVAVSIDGASVKYSGETSVNIPDTQSKGWTNFAFSVYDAVDTIDVAKPVTITIKASGPNGTAKSSISGVAR